MAREFAFYFLCVLNLLEYAFLQPDKKLSSKSSTSKDYGVQLSIKILLLSTSGETKKLYYSSYSYYSHKSISRVVIPILDFFFACSGTS